MNSRFAHNIFCTILIAIVIFITGSQAYADNSDNSARTGETGTENSKVLRACHSTWGKLGGKDLPYQGIHAHFVEAVFTKAGYEVKTDIINWARCIQSVKIMKYDVTMAWESEEFRKDYKFFSYAIKTPLNFITLNDSPLADGTFGTMIGKRVAYVRNTGGLDNYYAREDEFQSIPVSTVDQLFKMMEYKRIDAFIIDPVSLEDELNNKFPHLKGKMKILQPPIQVNIASPAMSLNHPRLKEVSEAYEKAYQGMVNVDFVRELERIHQMPVIR